MSKDPVRYDVRAPLRPDFPGIRIAGYYFKTQPPTLVELSDGEEDGPHEGAMLRVGVKTWSRIAAAGAEGRLIVTIAQGDRAAADEATIARLGRDLEGVRSELREVQEELARERARIAPLQQQAQADAATVATQREQLAAAQADADKAKAAAAEASRQQAQSEQRAAALQAELDTLKGQAPKAAKKTATATSAPETK